MSNAGHGKAIICLAGLMLVAPSSARAALQDSQETPAPLMDDKTPTVTVKGEKKVVKKAIDKTVYSTANNPKADNGTALDVLQATPTLSVTAEGQISVKGNANVTVLVNGKPSAALSGEARAVTLQTLTGSDIASIEVITNPSAAYNANGGAIVNIVLKNNRKAGAHGTSRGNATDQGLWNINASGDYTRGKLSLHGSLGLRRDGNVKFRQSDVNWRDSVTGHTGENAQSSEVFVRRWVQSATAGLDYDLSEKDSLNAAASYNFRRSRPFLDEFHQDYDAGVLTDSYHRLSQGPNQQSDDSLSLGYTHQDNDTLLKASAQHSDTIGLVDKSFQNAFVFPLQAPDYERLSNKTGRHIDQASLDYARPLSPESQLSLGLDYQAETHDIGNMRAAVDPITGIETPDIAASHDYRVIVTQSAAYITGQRQAGNWQVLAGARYEALTTRLKAGSPMAAPQTSTRSQSLNPSLTVKYTLSSDHTLSLSYRQSLQRPDPGDLDPYITYWDAQNLFTGNPNLRPQGVKALELSYDADQAGLSRSLGAFYRRSRDTVVDVRTFTSGNILLNTKANAGNGLSTGVNGSLDWKPTEKLRLTADGGVYYVELETVDMGRPVKQSGISYYANLGVSYSSGPDELSFDAHVTGPGLMPQGTYSASNTLSLTWKRRLTSRLTFSLAANDLLDGSKSSFTTTTATIAQRGYNHFVARRVYIGFVYKIG